MNNTSKHTLAGKHESFWLATTPRTDYPSMPEGLEVDVVVVGGGIAGLTTAYLIKKAGKKVAVLEADRIVTGATGYTTAKVTSLHTLIYKQLIDQFGKEKARQYGEAQQAAIEKIDELAKENNIACDFLRVPSYTYAESYENLERVKTEVEAAKSLGLPASFVEETPLPFPVRGAVRFEAQAQFHPRKYLLGLASLANGNGSYIFENTRVTDVSESEPCVVTTENGEIKAKDVVVATHFPIFNQGYYFARLTPLRSYVLGVYLNGPVPKGMFINLETPLYSIRSQSTEKGPLMIVTGEEHKTGQENNTLGCYQEIEKITRERFPLASIDYTWSTQDCYTPDEVPYIGRYLPNLKHLYLATGFNGWGMTNGTVSGMILTDLILGKENPWASVFDPSRMAQIKSIKGIVGANVNVAKQFVLGYLPKAKLDLARMKENEAKVFDWEGQKVAVYKDEEGNLHAISAVCTHLGCIVNWNNTEHSWDCPCHGSRFTPDGKVLHDPTVKNLSRVELKE